MAEGVAGKGLTEWREKLRIVYVHSVSKRRGDKDNTFGIFTLLVPVVEKALVVHLWQNCKIIPCGYSLINTTLGLFYASRFCPVLFRFCLFLVYLSPAHNKHKTYKYTVFWGRMIDDTDADVDVTLKDIAKDVAVDAETEESADVPGRQAESQTQIYQIDLEHADKVLSMQDDEVEPTELQEVVEVVTTTKLITKVVTAVSATITAAATQLTTAAALTLTTAPSATRRRKGVDEAYARELKEKLNKNIDSDEVIDHVQRKEKEDNVMKRYQALKRKPQTEAQARKNMMIYLRNVAGFKMDYFKGMAYDDIHTIFEKKFNSNVAFLQKIKEQMKEEDNKALKRLSESQEDKTAKKQKLDEEVEELRKHLQIVPNDDDDVYTEATPLALKIITFTTTQLILLVERKYPLTRFTLNQMLNNVRLEVEEESEVSLELLRFIRQQLFGVDAAKDFKENYAK
nr:hypothetical protein [Tanacetum cinerariifolium]